MTRRNVSDLQRDPSSLTDAIRRTLPFAGAVLAGAGVAQAQQADEAGLETVVVSAQKRTESLQDVPLSIQAIGEKQLQELKVDDFADYVKYLPSVSYQSAGPGLRRRAKSMPPDSVPRGMTAVSGVTPVSPAR